MFVSKIDINDLTYDKIKQIYVNHYLQILRKI